MGLVQCKKHGYHSGPMCCEHTLDAIYGRGPRVKYENVKFDVSGDGKEILQHLICEDCIEKYSLNGNGYVEEKVWESEQLFPWVCPVCNECLKEYEEKHNKSFKFVDAAKRCPLTQTLGLKEE